MFLVSARLLLPLYLFYYSHANSHIFNPSLSPDSALLLPSNPSQKMLLVFLCDTCTYMHIVDTTYIHSEKNNIFNHRVQCYRQVTRVLSEKTRPPTTPWSDLGYMDSLVKNDRYEKLLDMRVFEEKRIYRWLDFTSYRHLNEKWHKLKGNQITCLGPSWVVESFNTNIPTVGTHTHIRPRSPR